MLHPSVFVLVALSLSRTSLAIPSTFRAVDPAIPSIPDGGRNPAVTVIADVTISLAASGVTIVGSKTASPGGPPVTVNGDTTVFLQRSSVAINGYTFPLALSTLSQAPPPTAVPKPTGAKPTGPKPTGPKPSGAKSTTKSSASTSTITAIPGIIIRTIESDAWTGTGKDTIKTKAPGSQSTTTAHAVWGCKGCGGNHHGILIWNLPKNVGPAIVNIPNGPSFGIDPNGDPEPEPTPEGGAEGNPQNNPKTKQSTTKRTSSKSKCSTKTTSFCDKTCLSLVSQTQTCDTKCRTTTGCSVTCTKSPCATTTTIIIDGAYGPVALQPGPDPGPSKTAAADVAAFSTYLNVLGSSIQIAVGTGRKTLQTIPKTTQKPTAPPQTALKHCKALEGHLLPHGLGGKYCICDGKTTKVAATVTCQA